MFEEVGEVKACELVLRYWISLTLTMVESY